MNTLRSPAQRAVLFPFVSAALAAAGLAQNTGYVFSTSQTEATLSGSGGTVLQTLRPNEVAAVEFVPCPVISAEKWAPRTCFNTMAGDDDGNGQYDNPAMFGSIDALCDVLSPLACPTARVVFWSPSAPMGNTISGANQLRPGDTGRIVRNGAGDGQVEYFLRAEDVQIALGMPPTPVVVDVDAICADPGYGVFFSLDQTHVVNCGCGVTLVRDGDVICIPTAAITWTIDNRVAAVVPGSALVVYNEAQMDAMVANAAITDRFGNCITLIQDCEALDIDWSGPVTLQGPCTANMVPTPTLVFAGELMTGCGLCSTDLGGSIWNGGCGTMGSPCGTPLPTTGAQLGLLPPSAAVGVPSYVSAFSLTHISRFTLEPQQHTVVTPAPVSIDVFVPNAWSIVFAQVVVPTVAPSLPFPNCFFPDVYVLPWAWSSPFTGPAWQTVTTPVVTFPGIKVVFQAGTILSSGQIVVSTPGTVDFN